MKPKGAPFMRRLDEAFKRIFQDGEVFYEFLRMFLPDVVNRYIDEAGDEELLKVGEVDGMLSKLVKSLREEATIEAIVSVLEKRFGEVPEDLREKLSKVKDTGELRKLLRKSVSVESIEEFREILREIRG